MTTLLYQAYGQPYILNECLFSVLSFLRHGSPTLSNTCRILIYTDQPEFFKPWLSTSSVPVDYEVLSPEQIQEYRGAIDFVHRVKVKIIEHFFAQHAGHLFYVDSDTVFTHSPVQLLQTVEEGGLVMHICEGRISDKINPIFKKMHRFLRRHRFVVGDQSRSIPTDTAMWNAGVLGIPREFKDLVPQVLSLTDQMYALYPKHVMEQFAFSYILSLHGSILPADREIHHYWDFKEFRTQIAEFLEGQLKQKLEQKLESRQGQGQGLPKSHPTIDLGEVLQAQAPVPQRPPARPKNPLLRLLQRATWS